MKVYTIDEINHFGIDYQALKDRFTLKISNRVFVRSADFPKRFKEQAIAACQKTKQTDLNSFLVETTPFLLTLWTEQKVDDSSVISDEVESQTVQPSNESPSSIRYYRGVPYQASSQTQDLNQSDLKKLAAENPELRGDIPKKNTFPNHPVRTYRGVPY
jgi:hypothetical protein